MTYLSMDNQASESMLYPDSLSVSRVIMLVVLTLLIAIASQPTTAGDQRVRVGIYENPPLISMDSDGGAAGFFSEIVEHIADEEGWDVEYFPATFSQSMLDLEAGKIDILPVVAFSRERKKKYDFNQDNVLTNWGQLYTLKKSGIVGLSDLSGKKVAVLKRDIHYKKFKELIDGFGIDCELVETNSYHDVLKLVADKRVDAGVVNRFFGLKYGDEYHVAKSGVIFNPISIHFAFTKGKSWELINTVDGYVRAIKQSESSVYYRGMDKWLGTITVSGISLSETFMMLSVLIILIFLAYLVLHLTVLRRALGMGDVVEERVVVNILVGTFLFVVLLWVGLAIVEYLWFNSSGMKLFDHMLPLDSPRRMLFRPALLGFILLGGVVVSRVFSRLIHEQRLVKESETKFRSIFHSSVVGMVVVIDCKGLITEWNRGAEIAFGYSAQEVVGQSLTVLMPERYREAHSRGFLRAVEQRGLSYSGVTHELSGLRKNGEEFPLELTLGCWEMGGVLSFSAIVLDITDRKQTEQTLRRVQKMDAIGQLTGGIAHDFNNILGIIIGNISLLKTQLAGDSTLLKRVDAIEKSANRAVNLTKQLLGFSRKQATQASLTDISRVIEEMDSLISRSLTPDVEVRQQFAKDLWLTKIDPGDFQDALLNLIINARDAMHGRGKLLLKTCNCTLDADCCEQKPDMKPGEYVQLTVSDNGDGISSEQREHIFEPFFTTKPAGKGTGLGLAMVYGFVKRSKGNVEVDSESGGGTAFQIYLPRAEGVENPVEVSTEQKRTLPRGSESILVVDDEFGLLELAQESLQALGYRVITASNGQQALDQLAEDSGIDLLFIDVVMPGGINGYELAEQTVLKYPQVKVLLTSGYTDTSLEGSDKIPSHDHLLKKPYTQSELVQKVRDLLGDPEPGRVELNQPVSALNQPSAIYAQWSEDFNIDIQPLDDDHRELFELINRCRKAFDNHEAPENGYPMLDEIYHYAQYHFKREEKVMAACDYPDIKNHRQVHALLLKQARSMMKEEREGMFDIRSLLAFLDDWCVGHVQSMDRNFASYCRGNILCEQVVAQLKSESDAEVGHE
ncbi:MAG: bacteriohemerythrin [Gammaproteobacteria bacterium]|nr:bacteriohemerythrin [Gammaproteobacteria bacterium]